MGKLMPQINTGTLNLMLLSGPPSMDRIYVMPINSISLWLLCYTTRESYLRLHAVTQSSNDALDWTIFFSLWGTKPQCRHEEKGEKCSQCKAELRGIFFNPSMPLLTLSMQRLLNSSTAQGCKDFWEPSKPCHDGIHWIALAEYS